MFDTDSLDLYPKKNLQSLSQMQDLGLGVPPMLTLVGAISAFPGRLLSPQH